MFNRKRNEKQSSSPFSQRPITADIERLEDRRLLSAGFHHGGGGGYGFEHDLSTIPFSQAPTVVQTGLDSLASKDNVTAPTSTQTVFLGNSRGVETYTVDIVGTGTDTRLTVDQNGNPVTVPTNSTTTFGAITNTGVTGEINKIASALSLTAPTSSTSVRVTTAANGTSIYTVRLGGSSTSDRHGRPISVDSSGNPVGNQNLPYSALPSAIQNGLNTNRPSGATALDATSTQTVRVRTANGVTTYSTTFTSGGTQTTVTVDSTGKLTKLPSHSTVQFQNIPKAAQTELQTLATANGVSGTISATQSVDAYDEANGTTIYSVTLSASKTGSSGQTYTFNITISVDQSGNPTTTPHDNGEGEGEGFGGFGDHFGNFNGFGLGGFGFFGRRRGK